jgi:DNA polymerase IV
VDPVPTFRWILHLDLDQFLAAVEIRRRPELRGRPVVVGGDGDPHRPRQVVSTASSEARRFGVRSGMPLSTAARRCPDAVFLPVDHEAYDAASAQVWATVRELPATVEVWGWDEGFLGIDDPDPLALAHSARDLVRTRTGLTCCVGIGDNKLTAKLATGFAKAPSGEPPDTAPGIACLTRESWDSVMAERPTEAIWGIGSRTATKLAEMGVRTVADLAAADEPLLARRFGPRTGPWLRRLGQGRGSREVSSVPQVARGRSHEETFTHDITERSEVESKLRELAQRVTRDVVADGRVITQVSIKVRLVPFRTTTRVHKLPAPTTDPAVVAQAAVALLDRLGELRPVRLLGVRVELAPPAGQDAAPAVSDPAASGPDISGPAIPGPAIPSTGP